VRVWSNHATQLLLLLLLGTRHAPAPSPSTSSPYTLSTNRPISSIRKIRRYITMTTSTAFIGSARAEVSCQMPSSLLTAQRQSYNGGQQQQQLHRQRQQRRTSRRKDVTGTPMETPTGVWLFVRQSGRRQFVALFPSDARTVSERSADPSTVRPHGGSTVRCGGGPSSERASGTQRDGGD
jgi:hypothetical protein